MGENNGQINEKPIDKRLKNLEKGTWKPGQSGNPKGRPLGQRDYATIYKEALIKLASLNKKTPEELEDEMVSVGLLNARKGDYKFYKDVLDRLHGTPVQHTDLTSKGEKLSIEISQAIAAKNKLDVTDTSTDTNRS